MKNRKIIRNKRKKIKKIIIISTLCLLFVITAGYAAFQTNLNITAKGNIYNKGDLCYETSDNGDGTVTITNYDKTCGSDVVIPETIKGKTVTKIAGTTYNNTSSFNGKNLTSVTIPDTVTFIGNYAFYNNSITSLNLGNGVLEIGREAFHSNCIEYLDFPESLQKIGDGAFLRNCLISIPNLDGITYGHGAFTDNYVTGDEVFVYKKNEDGSIDNTVLNSYAGGRAYISTLTLPEGIKELGPYSLRYVSAYQIILPNTVEKISSTAIMQSGADILYIPNSIKEIDANAFLQTTQIKVINIDKTQDSIPNSPWGATNAEVIWASD